MERSINWGAYDFLRTAIIPLVEWSIAFPPLPSKGRGRGWGLFLSSMIRLRKASIPCCSLTSCQQHRPTQHAASTYTARSFDLYSTRLNNHLTSNQPFHFSDPPQPSHKGGRSPWLSLRPSTVGWLSLWPSIVGWLSLWPSTVGWLRRPIGSL